MRGDLAAAQARIKHLEALLAAEREKCTLGPPSRATVTKAIRRVTEATGHADTAAALRQLAAAAEDWATAIEVAPVIAARATVDFLAGRRAA